MPGVCDDGEVMACRVFIADDVEGIRTLWRLLLEEDRDIVVVGEAADGDAALAGIAKTAPDVALLDLSMPVRDGLEVLQTLQAEVPDLPVVVASGFATTRLSELAVGLGAFGYFQKGDPPDELVEIVRSACRAPARRAA